MSVNILEILKSVDISQIQQELVEAKSSRETMLRECNASIEALEMTIKLASKVQGVAAECRPSTPPKAKPGSTLSRESGKSQCDLVFDYLQENGPAKPMDIARGIGMTSPASIYALLGRDDRFERLDDNYWMIREADEQESEEPAEQLDTSENLATECDNEPVTDSVEYEAEPEPMTLSAADKAEIYIRTLGMPAAAMSIGAGIGLPQPKDMLAILEQDDRFRRVTGGFWKLA